MSKVLIVGITGKTGRVIADELLAAGTFHVSAIVRPSSLDKPEVKELQAAGVEIRVGDIAADSVDTLRGLLKGVDIVISAVIVLLVDQRNLILAAKEAGVKRIVPSDFGPHIPRGVMRMVDQKIAIRDFVISTGIGYTFIEVGWWLGFLFPYPHSVQPSLFEESMTVHTFIGQGDKKVAATELNSIGKFVRRIIEDPRTLNKTVLAWEHELTLKEIWKLGEKISGEDYSDYPKLSGQQLQQLMDKSEGQVIQVIHEYNHAIFVRGDNSVSNAVAAGVLDARALYPDTVPVDLEEFVQECYKSPHRVAIPEELTA